MGMKDGVAMVGVPVGMKVGLEGGLKEGETVGKTQGEAVDGATVGVKEIHGEEWAVADTDEFPVDDEPFIMLLISHLVSGNPPVDSSSACFFQMWSHILRSTIGVPIIFIACAIGFSSTMVLSGGVAVGARDGVQVGVPDGAADGAAY